jgi:hypothetical protein
MIHSGNGTPHKKRKGLARTRKYAGRKKRLKNFHPLTEIRGNKARKGKYFEFHKNLSKDTYERLNIKVTGFWPLKTVANGKITSK